MQFVWTRNSCQMDISVVDKIFKHSVFLTGQDFIKHTYTKYPFPVFAVYSRILGILIDFNIDRMVISKMNKNVLRKKL